LGGRCWESQIKASVGGLFHSYLQAEDGPGCQRLRDLLASSLPSLVREGCPPPEWLAAIRHHHGLLDASLQTLRG
jgi:hypothetical protein